MIMTPQAIFEHRQKWMSSDYNHPVKIHSDLRNEARDYCKVQMFKCQWHHVRFTDVYEDTFYFEHHQDQKSFANHFKKWLIDY